MYINNAAIPPHSDLSTGFYGPDPDSPPDGACGVGPYAALAFTLAGGVDIQATNGITVCPTLFTNPTTSSLGSPVPNGGVKEINRFRDTGGMTILHEFMHMITSNGKKA